MTANYYLVQLSSLSASEREAIRVITSNLPSYKDLVSIAIGRALAGMHSIPTTEVESIRDHFTMNASIEVKNNISLIREYCDIDSQAIVEYAEKFYRLRYMMVLPNKPIYCINPEVVTEAALNITDVIETEAIKLMRAHPTEFCMIHNAAMNFLMLQQLKVKGSEWWMILTSIVR